MSSTAIGWVRVATHLGRDHGGQVLDELAGQLPGNAAVPDDDPGPDDGHRDTGRSEQLLDLAAAAQVCRQGVLVVAEPSEVDDLLQPGPRTRLPECRGGGGILALEVQIAERVHEVIGRHGSRPSRRPGYAGRERLRGRACRLRCNRRGCGSWRRRRGQPRPGPRRADGRRSRTRRRRAPSSRPLNVLGLGDWVARHQPGPHGARASAAWRRLRRGRAGRAGRVRRAPAGAARGSPGG